jgi:hypothetical protein
LPLTGGDSGLIKGRVLWRDAVTAVDAPVGGPDEDRKPKGPDY